MKESTCGFALCDTDGSIVGLSGDHMEFTAEMGISDLAAFLCHRSLSERYRSFIDSGLKTQVLTSDDPSTPLAPFRRIVGRNGALVTVEWGPDAARQKAGHHSPRSGAWLRCSFMKNKEPARRPQTLRYLPQETAGRTVS